MADTLALVKATTNSQKMKSAMKNMWDERKQLKASAIQTGSFEMVLRVQVDEVFLVLAHLGEAILPLGVFNKDYYLQTLGDVQAAVSSCGNELLSLAWAELDAELQYVCTAGMAFCACYAPMPVYRGFGACVLSDYDWACPDTAYLDEKAKKKALWTVYGVKQKVDSQPTRSIFLAFDHTIQLLQVKPLAFLAKRPLVSGFAEHQPKYGGKPKREVKDDHDLLEDWLKQLERYGHPGPTGTKMTSWGVPFATWTSPFSCQIMKTAKDSETIIYHQMDPGRLLHGFLCRGNGNLDEGQIFLLMPGSPAESILCWLEGLPGTTHKIVRWQNLDTTHLESKIGKSMRKKIGKYPLPTQFAIRDLNASTMSGTTAATSSPSVLEHPNTVSPPPYSPDGVTRQPPTAELGPPSPSEVPATPIDSQLTTPAKSAVAAIPRQMPVPPSEIARMGVAAGLKSIHTLLRMPSAQAMTTGGPSTIPAVPATPSKKTDPKIDTVSELDSHPAVTELPASTAIAEAPSSSAAYVAELPTEFQTEAPKPLEVKPALPARRSSEQLRETFDEPLKATEHAIDSESGEAPASGHSAHDRLTSDDNIARPTPSDNDIAIPTAIVVQPPTPETPEDTSTTRNGVSKVEHPHVVKRKQLPAASKAEPIGSEASSETPKYKAYQPPATSTADEYLSLLNDVAKGRMTPQALTELLQSKGLLQVDLRSET